MVSINSTVANSAVLANLRKINSDIAINQTRIGTGKKINKYSDNPALFATAQSIRSDMKRQEELASNIGISKARADAASAGLDKISDILSKMSAAAATITTDSTTSELTVAKGKVAGYKTQLTAVLAASGFQSKNLTAAGVTETVVLSTESGASIAFLSVDTANGTAYKDLVDTKIAAATTNTLMAGLVAEIEEAQAEVSAAQGKLTAFSDMLGSQIDFQTTLKGISETALGSIVDADLEEESAKSAALQVKQQLAYQALSIGNNAAQNILLLFR